MNESERNEAVAGENGKNPNVSRRKMLKMGLYAIPTVVGLSQLLKPSTAQAKTTSYITFTNPDVRII